jgi:hypothetical protein
MIVDTALKDPTTVQCPLQCLDLKTRAVEGLVLLAQRFISRHANRLEDEWP